MRLRAVARVRVAGIQNSPAIVRRTWLHERFYTHDRRRKPSYRLRAQQRELRAQRLAVRVILHDFADRRCCSREIVINVHVSLDELIRLLVRVRPSSC